MHVNYLREVKQNNTGRLGVALLLLMLTVALLAPVLSTYQPAQYTKDIFSPPSTQYWLGTNDVGQDIWARLLYGARTSIAVGIGVAVTSTLLSLLIGGTCALFGGLYDRFWMRLVDVFIVIPPVLVAILVAAYLRPHVLLLVLLLSAFFWPGGARIVRSQTLSLIEKTPMTAARTFGAGWGHIMLRHVAPDLGPILVVLMIQDARRAVFMEAGLSFLGVSDPSIISWGKMMQQALEFTYLEVWKWWLVPTGIALSLTLTGFTFTGFALETALNPRLRREVSRDAEH